MQKMPLDSPEIQSLLNMAQEEAPPFPGARRVLQWEQRIVSYFKLIQCFSNVHQLQTLV